LTTLITFAVILAGWWFLQKGNHPVPESPIKEVYFTTAVSLVEPTLTQLFTTAPSLTPRPSATPQPTPTQKPSQVPSATPTQVIIVSTTKNAFVRFGPGTVYNKITSFVVGTSMEILGCNSEGTWLLVKTPDGITGWIAITLVDFSNSVSLLTVYPDPPTPTATKYIPPTPNRDQHDDSQGNPPTPTPKKYP